MQPEQSLADYIGEVQLILSELTDIGDTSFNKYSLISKLSINFLEGFDILLTAWDIIPLENQTFANLQLDSTRKKLG